MKRPRITKKVLAGLGAALAEMECNIQERSGTGSEDTAEEVEEFDAACKWVQEMSAWVRRNA